MRSHPRMAGPPSVPLGAVTLGRSELYGAGERQRTLTKVRFDLITSSFSCCLYRLLSSHRSPCGSAVDVRPGGRRWIETSAGTFVGGLRNDNRSPLNVRSISLSLVVDSEFCLASAPYCLALDCDSVVTRSVVPVVPNCLIVTSI